MGAFLKLVTDPAELLVALEACCIPPYHNFSHRNMWEHFCLGLTTHPPDHKLLHRKVWEVPPPPYLSCPHTISCPQEVVGPLPLLVIVLAQQVLTSSSIRFGTGSYETCCNYQKALPQPRTLSFHTGSCGGRGMGSF